MIQPKANGGKHERPHAFHTWKKQEESASSDCGAVESETRKITQKLSCWMMKYCSIWKKCLRLNNKRFNSEKIKWNEIL